jgi:(p)ppGpp synthase/HD superfamily hydrolase
MTTLPLSRFEKLVLSARYWLLGLAENEPKYYKVLEAMELCLSHHDGVRNGGDPEAIHQLGIFHQIRTSHKHLRNPDIVYILIFLHDAVEDENQKTKAFISLEEVEATFGPVIRDKVKKLSKNILGQKNEDYSLDVIFDDEDCSVAKGGDRCNNVSTMYGVFKPARLKKYVLETADEFFPRLKSARRKFPHQEAVYEAIKLSLVGQLTLIQHLMEGMEQDEQSKQ